MLLLERRHGESIVIGDDIRVTIYQRPGNKVCVGISAPSEVPVHREEIYRRLQSQEAPRDALNREVPRRRFLRLPARP